MVENWRYREFQFKSFDLEWKTEQQRIVGNRDNAKRIPSPCEMKNEWPTHLWLHFEPLLASDQALDIPRESIARVNRPSADHPRKEGSQRSQRRRTRVGHAAAEFPASDHRGRRADVLGRISGDRISRHRPVPERPMAGTCGSCEEFGIAAERAAAVNTLCRRVSRIALALTKAVSATKVLRRSGPRVIEVLARAMGIEPTSEAREASSQF